MTNSLELKTPRRFSFRHTVGSHGWYDLPPFDHVKGNGEMRYVFQPESKETAVSVLIANKRGKLNVTLSEMPNNTTRIVDGVRHILRLDDDLNEFYGVLKTDERLSWIADVNAGRLLRSATVWEDLVKTICTTNCSWALTKKMVVNLVEKLGETAADGRRAFPTAEAMAAQNADFYRDEIRAGYRSSYFAELANNVAGGKLDVESWLRSDLPTPLLKKELKKVKGVGDYAAENLLKLLGRFDGLALDSWLRGQFYKTHNNGRVCKDKKIERFYSKFGDWKGLAIWCDMTESWFR
jgi:3-methyladenine DNA glycosylase/8-oxoguanine DNA glycosylase